eukprot:4101928-Amphidinium_carterae.1
MHPTMPRSMEKKRRAGGVQQCWCGGGRRPHGQRERMNARERVPARKYQQNSRQPAPSRAADAEPGLLHLVKRPGPGCTVPDRHSTDPSTVPDRAGLNRPMCRGSPGCVT